MRPLTSAGAADLAVLGCAVGGGVNRPQRPRAAFWYRRLRKPGYTPAAPAVGATWGVLEILLTILGYRLLRAPASRAPARALTGWALTLLGLAGFAWLFFGERRLGASTAAAMLAAAATCAVATRRVDDASAALLTPVVAWLGFATLLSEELLRRNRKSFWR